MTEVLTAQEVNSETGKVTVRPFTVEEIAQRESDAAAHAAADEKFEAAEAARISAIAKLAALGLTADEIVTLTK